MPFDAGVEALDYLQSGTWTKPAWAVLVHMECFGGASGGAAGIRTDPDVGSAAGGGGGVHGDYADIWYPAELLPATLDVTVGSGGAGTPGALTDDSGGGVGDDGGSSYVGDTAAPYCYAAGGTNDVSHSKSYPRTADGGHGAGLTDSSDPGETGENGAIAMILSGTGAAPQGGAAGAGGAGGPGDVGTGRSASGAGGGSGQYGGGDGGAGDIGCGGGGGGGCANGAGPSGAGGPGGGGLVRMTSIGGLTR